MGVWKRAFSVLCLKMQCLGFGGTGVQAHFGFEGDSCEGPERVE